jgi:PAS domain S-box-containing protein
VADSAARIDEEARYRDLFENASDGIVVTDPDFRILDANPAFIRMTGYAIDEMRGRRVDEFYATEADLDVTGRIILEGGTAVRRRTIRTKLGGLVEIEGRGTKLSDGTFLGLYRDVTESVRIAEDRRRMERIESLGILAGGIAHDFNNILAAALGFVELAQQQAADPVVSASVLDRAVAALERARKLTQQLLAFARGGEPVRQVIALPPLIREYAEFALRGSNVRSRIELGRDLWPIEADEGQVGQVLHNLVLNAQQAMPAGGEVVLSARNVPTGETVAGFAAPGPCVAIQVRDAGGGVPEENVARIFDPYFTTKPGGVGLGLPTAFRIVQRHGGHLALAVDPGRGSTFTVVLPALPGSSPPSSAVRAPIAVDRRGRVLVMDDEPVIREMLGEVLGRAGFEVEGVPDGEQAVAVWERAIRERRPFDLAIVDLTIPGGMGGRDAVLRLRALDPGCKAIVSSGYSNDPVMSRFRDEGFDGVCVKPYRLSDLLAEVARVLGRGRR